MASLYKEGNKINFNGFKGTIIHITETYRKNVLVVKVSEIPKHTNAKLKHITNKTTIGIFEYPDGTLEFMNVIE